MSTVHCQSSITTSVSLAYTNAVKSANVKADILTNPNNAQSVDARLLRQVPTTSVRERQIEQSMEGTPEIGINLSR